MSSPRPSWRPLLAGTAALFLIVLAFLAGQLRAGADPALGRSTQQTLPQSTPSAPDGSGSDDGFVPGGTDPAPPTAGGSAPNGFAPDGSAPDGSDPDGSAPESPSRSSDAPTTQQS